MEIQAGEFTKDRLRLNEILADPGFFPHFEQVKNLSDIIAHLPFH